MTAPEGNLQVSLASYKPHVACDSRAPLPSLSSCRRLIDEIPFGQHSRPFIKQLQDGRGIVKLPRSFDDCEDIAVKNAIHLDRIKG